MQAERTRVIAAIKDFADGLKAEKSAAPSTQSVDARIRELLNLACERVGVSPDEYARMLAEDDVLAKLEHDAIVQAIAGAPDPGPHDAISREAATGQPGDVSNRGDKS